MRKAHSGRKNRLLGEIIKHCSDCKNSYGFHEIGFDGKPFICKCNFYTNGKYSKFLNDRACENFKQREA